MSKFEQTFRLWLASYRVPEEDCDKLCAIPQIAGSIKRNDGSGLVIDLPGCLYGFEKAEELRKALSSPIEQLMLMKILEAR
jgi:hypothetical protein